jgi:3-deoxy-D-manno-octulosonic-acid transferase
LRLILVPRHPDRFEAVARLLDQSKLSWRRRTALVGQALPDMPTDTSAVRQSLTYKAIDTSPVRQSLTYKALSPQQQPRILLVDVVGELGAWWGTARIAFVGGSFGRRGGQNMIEPAAYGAAVSFGPNTWNFSDIVSNLLAQDAAMQCADAAELERFVRRCLKEPEYAAELGRRAKSLVLSQLGATERTFLLLTNLAN